MLKKSFTLATLTILALTLACGAADSPSEEPGPTRERPTPATEALNPTPATAKVEPSGNDPRPALLNLSTPSPTPGNDGLAAVVAAAPSESAGRPGRPEQAPTPTSPLIPTPIATAAAPVPTPRPTLRPLLDVTSSKTDWETLLEINAHFVGGKRIVPPCLGDQ